MAVVTGKKILVVSPQQWGRMLLSKHHYALELAKAGNEVYFLNPPDQLKALKKREIKIVPSGIENSLHFVEHRLFFPFWIKFKSITLFHFLMQFHVRRMMKVIGAIDMIWSFDIGNTYTFKFFPPNSLRIFHPVDEPLSNQAIKAAEGADIIFSVTKEILEKYRVYKAPKYFVHHGVTEDFLKLLDTYKAVKVDSISVGYSGNLLREDIDRTILIRIVRENPQVTFHFFGSYQVNQTNIGGVENKDFNSFIGDLQKSKNIVLHGVLNQNELAKQFAGMDAFIVCYDIEKDQSKGTNYHKLMEYFATGKIVISNNITTYAEFPHLIQMTESRKSNDSLPDLFKKVINSLSIHNSHDLIAERKKFAYSNTYSKQIETIGEKLDSVEKKHYS